MNSGIALVLFAIWGTLVFLVAIAWTLHRLLLHAKGTPSRVAPNVATGQRVALYDTYVAYIPMPNNIRTAEEMVAWMTKELPKLTAANTNVRP